MHDMDAADANRYGATPPLVDPAELPGWIIEEDGDLLVFNKPGWLVCHPSKNGPMSSLIGAARAYCGLDRLHLVSRLDRETSGVVVLAKHAAAASRLQTAFADRRVDKTYIGLLEGLLRAPVTVDAGLMDDPHSPVLAQQKVTFGRPGKPACTEFRPLAHGAAHTLAEIRPHTGRKHQIRAHARWLGHPVAGDKIYGPDPTLYLEFAATGWTPRLAAALTFPRQALHAATLTVPWGAGSRTFQAPLPADMQAWIGYLMTND